MNEKIKAIRGNKERAEEVIKWLVNHGARDAIKQVDGNDSDLLYFVTEEGNVGCIETEYKCLVDVEELPHWRAEIYHDYWYIDAEMDISSETDCRGYIANRRYMYGNYFKTEAEAEEMRDRVVELLKLGSNE